MPCQWLYLASRIIPEHLCGKPGDPYCPEHQREINLIHSLDDDWKEVEATHRAVCEEPTKEEQKLCAACNCRPTHADCSYCEDCCADDSLNFLGPQA
jgi:hypothetical protein